MEEKALDRKEPIFITPSDTFLAKDRIRPYGSWIGDFSNERLKETIKEMWQDKTSKQNNG